MCVLRRSLVEVRINRGEWTCADAAVLELPTAESANDGGESLNSHRRSSMWMPPAAASIGCSVPTASHRPRPMRDA